MEAWAHGVKVLAKIARRHPQSVYAELRMSLQSEWQYLQRTVPGVGTLMGPIEEVIREKLFPSLFGGEKLSLRASSIRPIRVPTPGTVLCRYCHFDCSDIPNPA